MCPEKMERKGKKARKRKRKCLRSLSCWSNYRVGSWIENRDCCVISIQCCETVPKGIQYDISIYTIHVFVESWICYFLLIRPLMLANVFGLYFRLISLTYLSIPYSYKRTNGYSSKIKLKCWVRAIQVVANCGAILSNLEPKNRTWKANLVLKWHCLI